MRNFLTICGFALVIFALTAGAALADGPAEGRNGRAELRFLEGMIDHHQMALDMAEDCLTHAGTDEVVSLCTGIIAAQAAEIAQMQQWLRDWYNVDYTPVSMLASFAEAGEAMAGMDHSHGGHGAAAAEFHTDPAMTMGMMAGLNRLEGREYEVAWIESMIDHHDAALHMAERMLTRVVHDELRVLAEQIIADQTAEIAQMEALLAAYDEA